MELNMTCIVSHGICWNGGVREYQGDIMVNLNEDEIKAIHDVANQSNDESVFYKVEEELPAIYEKIEKASFDFKVYTFVLETCVRWSEEYGEVREEDLIEEDIRSGKFVPLYINAEGAPRDPLIMNQWFVWMIESLKNLSYRKRADYLINRYQMKLPAFDDLEFEVSYRLS